MSPRVTGRWLLGQGWRETGRMGDIAALFGRGTDEVLLPLNPSSTDFRLRWTELVTHLARVDDVDPDTVLLRIEREGVDVAEYNAGGGELTDHSIPLFDVQILLDSVRRMVSASANSAVQPRSHFGHSYPKLVTHHTRNIRMGQTRRGSYIVPIISPVPVLRVPKDGELEEAGLFEQSVGYVPFARQAMEQLASSLQLLEGFTQNPNTATPQALNASVRDGVSYEMAAGLAEALAPESIDRIHVNFSWAQQVRIAEPITTVTFAKSAAEPLKAISEELRDRDVTGEQTLTGYVKSVSREEGDESGKVVIRSIVGDQLRLIAMAASVEQCDVAARVQSQHGYLHVTGVLERESGKQMRFGEITDFHPRGSLAIEP